MRGSPVQLVKKVFDFFDRAYPPGILKAFKMPLRPKALMHQAFLRRFIQFEAGLFLAAARSRHGSDMPPACHSLPCRRFATLKLPCCSISLLCSMDSLTVSTGLPQMRGSPVFHVCLTSAASGADNPPPCRRAGRSLLSPGQAYPAPARDRRQAPAGKSP